MRNQYTNCGLLLVITFLLLYINAGAPSVSSVWDGPENSVLISSGGAVKLVRVHEHHAEVEKILDIPDEASEFEAAWCEESGSVRAVCNQKSLTLSLCFSHQVVLFLKCNLKKKAQKGTCIYNITSLDFILSWRFLVDTYQAMFEKSRNTPKVDTATDVEIWPHPYEPLILKAYSHTSGWEEVGEIPKTSETLAISPCGKKYEGIFNTLAID